MRCLIVDDDASPRALMERLIAEAGHRSRSVRSGVEALAVLASERFDVALVDLEMPGMDGASTIANLRAIASDLRILVVSGYDDRRHVMAALDAGANGYLVKDELGDALVKSLLEVRAGHSPLSPRVASILVRQVRRARGSEGMPPSTPVRTPSIRGRRPVRLRVGFGSQAHAIPPTPDDDDQ